MMRIRHYHRLYNGWNIPDETIEGLYSRMKNEGKDVWAFPGDNEPETPEMFRLAFQEGIESLYLIDKSCEYEDDHIMGFFWLNRFEHRLARIHFCSFDGFTLAEKIEAAETASDYILGLKDNDGHIFDVLEGRIAESNRAAQMLVCAAGFVKVGVIPNAVYDCVKRKSEPAVVFYKTRKN